MPAPERYYVLTNWGHVLTYDRAQDRLRAVPISERAPNVTAQLEKGGVRFSADLEDGAAIELKVHEDGAIRAGASHPNPLVVRGSGRHIHVRHGGLFLTATPEGTIMASAPRGLDWEQLSLLTENEYARLSSIVGASWYLPSRRKVTKFANHGNRGFFSFSIDDLSFALDDILEATPVAGPMDIILPHDVWKLEQLVRYNPLVYYCSFGREEGFRCLDHALDALRRHGEYDGAIRVLSERTKEKLCESYTHYRDDKIELTEFIPLDQVDYMSARFAITEHSEFDQYQPILYLDTDTVVNRPLGEIFSRMLHDHHDSICVFTETLEPSSDGYWGSDLFRDDHSALRPDFGFTTGMMLFRNLNLVRRSFDNIRATIMRQASLIGTRMALRCFDQPVANYVLHKFERLDTSLMGHHARNFDMWFNEADDAAYDTYAASISETILHFAGGVGAYDWKLAAMIRYCAWLDHAPTLAPRIEADIVS